MKELIQHIEGNFRQYNRLLGEPQSAPEKVDPSLEDNSLVVELVNRASEIQDEVVDYRLKKILREERPYIPSIRPADFRNASKVRAMSLRSVIRHFLEQRQELVKLLYSLPLDYWERTGVHEKEGHVSFKEFIRRMADKDRDLLEELNKAIARKRLS